VVLPFFGDIGSLYCACVYARVSVCVWNGRNEEWVYINIYIYAGCVYLAQIENKKYINVYM
jgi:hypothetical protein